jgi:hypothetical protein
MSSLTVAPADARPAAPPSTTWQTWADRLAGVAWNVLLVNIAFGLLGGALIGFLWQPSYSGTITEPLYIVHSAAYLLVIGLGLPSLAAGAWDLVRGRWVAGAGRVLAFAGPLVVALGAVIGSHLLIPCGQAPWLCDPYIDEAGQLVGSIKDRWHQLHHTLVAGLPLTILYGLALRRWRPTLPGLRRGR